MSASTTIQFITESTIIDFSPNTSTIIVAPTIPIGPRGIQGVQGVGVGYHHDQGIPEDIWHVNHNLGHIAAGIYVKDSAGTQHEPAIEHIDENNTDLFFLGAMGGTADFV